MTTIVIAAADIPKGTVIGWDMLDTMEVDRGILMSIDAVTEPDAVIGRRAQRDISAGEAVVSGSVSDLPSSHTELSYSIPEGLYAIEFPADYDNTVAGHVEEGDRVDIALLMKETPKKEKSGSDGEKKVEEPEEGWEILVENLEVIRLGSRMYSGEDMYDYVIIAAERTTVLKIMDAEEKGELKLILRSPVTEDSDE